MRHTMTFIRSRSGGDVSDFLCNFVYKVQVEKRIPDIKKNVELFVFI